MAQLHSAWFRRAPYTLREWLPDEIPNRSSPAASAATDQRGSQFHGKHTANTPSSHRTVARTASGGMVAKQPRPVNRRSPMDKKQRTRALQQPMFLFTKPQIF